MEKRTAEKGTPFVLFLRLYLRVELPNLPRSVRFFQRRDGKGVKRIRVECLCQGGSKGGSSSITNDILECPRTGSALKIDDVKPIRQINPKTGRPEIIKEFPATAQSHGFNDLVDNYAGHAAKSQIPNGTLYQLDGALNGVQGRFEWIIQDGNVTHRMFIQNGTMNGVPIKP